MESKYLWHHRHEAKVKLEDIEEVQDEEEVMEQGMVCACVVYGGATGEEDVQERDVVVEGVSIVMVERG